jgi:hypothetical protein
MAIDPSELEAFIHFARERIDDIDTVESLEETLRQFRLQQDAWTPRTPLGRRLKELREQFITEGGTLLTADEVAEERRSRQGNRFAEPE